MIGVKIQGRLGNQLFQYAYARMVSQKLRTTFFLHGYKYFYANKYFELKIDTKASNRWKMTQFYLHNLFTPKTVSENQFDLPQRNIEQEQDNVVYDGFYQSSAYHRSGLEKQLKEELIIKQEYRIDIRKFVPDNRPVIVVHVRRTDYITFGGTHLGGINLTLPLEYYQQALENLPVNESNILFLSDDINFVKANFKYPNAIYAEGNSEITDFQLLMQADYLVLANSSFSWWGAYLNTTAKVVISPKYWLGIKLNKEFPSMINCETWNKI